jgi:DNA-binding transcriptional MerR regulator/predicted transcriptional regulator YdeE
MLSIGAFARLGRVSPRMLRHYDEIGLLQPERVDEATGYRSYEVAQLARLHRVLALRDLGFTLDQIRAVVDDELSVEQLRGMLRMRRAQIEHDLLTEQARLARVEAHLRALERNPQMITQDIVLKTTDPVRIAEASGVAPGFGHENLNPVFAELLPEVLAHLERDGVRPGISVAWYEDPDDDGTVVLHTGFDIGNQTVQPDDRVRVVDLPAIEVAAVVHRGPMDDVEQVYEALMQWIDDSGYRTAGLSRELYLKWSDDNSAENVTELQMPVTK